MKNLPAAYVSMGVLLGAGIILLAGCAAAGEDDYGKDDTSEEVGVDTANEDIEERHVLLTDGRMIVCIAYDSYQEGGISCDWDNPISEGGF